jgi:phenylalanyl-tRNA synthetase beta chain
MEELQVTDYKLTPTTEPFLHPGTSCNIELEGKVIGYFGGLHPDVQKAFDLEAETYVLEMEVAPLEANATKVPHYKHGTSVPQHLPGYCGSSTC